MYIQNNFFYKKISILCTLIIILLFNLNATQERFNFTSSSGLKINIIKKKNMDFIHAQLLIFYRNKTINPAIPYLTFFNIFNKDLNKTGSSILNILRRLGNDYEVEHGINYLLLKINFLSDPNKIQLFTQFLKTLYRYKPLFTSSYKQDPYKYGNREADSIKKLNNSINNYWKLFLKEKDWKKKIAIQIAYNKLFPSHLMGNTLITPDSLNRISLSRIRSFYKKTYIPSNSLLIMKGNLNPHVTRGLIDIALKSFKKLKKEDSKQNILILNEKREIIIFDINKSDSPVIFWFETIPPLNNKNHIPFQIINEIIFGYPMGRLPGTATNFGIRISEMKTEIINHKDISILCNTIGLNFRDIEKFILLADSEKKKLRIRRIERKEYLIALNYFYGKLKVKTEKYDNDVNLEVEKSQVELKKENLQTPREIFQQITLNRINQTISNSKQNIIVIVGNSKLILENFNILKPTVIKFIQ